MLKALNACKKHLNQQRPLVERRRESTEKKDSFFGVGQDLTEEAYQRRRKRAKRVKLFHGHFLGRRLCNFAVCFPVEFLA